MDTHRDRKSIVKNQRKHIIKYHISRSKLQQKKRANKNRNRFVEKSKISFVVNVLT